MSFYSDASLVMIPSGYKTSKVYSAVPTDGAGDLSFSRSNDTATRVGPDGLIEKVRTNLATYSEDFTNAAWTKIYATVTANSVANPLNGATTADTITPTTDVDVHRFRITSTGLSAGQTYTFSFYAKANGYNFVRIIENTTTGDVKQFNLSNGTIDLGALSGQIVSLGNGWYRCAAQIVAASSQTIDVQIQEVSGTQIFAGNGTSGVYVFGAQLEISDFGATDYIATTSAAVSVGPVANVPRLDYLNSSCPRLLLEPQRTNIQINSENFSALAYENGTITSNNTTSPDGYVNADLYTEDTTNSYHRINVGNQTYTSGTAYTFSVFAKANGTGRYLCVNAQSAFNARTFFNLNTGVISLTELGSATITNYGNGWYRCTVTGTRTSGTSVDSMYFGLTTGLADLNYTGNGTNGFWGWGVQIENSVSYATSYIPTLGAAVTRGADSTYEESSSSLIGQTEGTLFAQFKGLTSSAVGASRFSISSGTSADWIFVGTEANNLRGYIRANSSVLLSDTSIATTGNDKIAVAYKSGSMALYINGVQIATSSSALSFSATLDDISTGVGGSYDVDDTILFNQVIVFPTRLTNAQLAELTTL